MSWFTNPEGKALLKSGDHSDYTITCGGHEFKVHKIIIGSKSKFFKVCTDGNFKEFNGVLDLPEQEPRILARALMYMYTGDYDEEAITEIWPALKKPLSGQEVRDKVIMEDAIKLYKFADALALPDLRKRVCIELLQCPYNQDKAPYNEVAWESTPTDKQRFERSRLRIATLFMDLVELVYEELPNDDEMRARVMVATLDATRSLPWPVHYNWDDNSWGRPSTSHQDSLEAVKSKDLRDRLSEFLKDTDLVAWNVARHYRSVIEDLVSTYDKKLAELKFGQRNVELGTIAGTNPFENVSRGLDAVYLEE